MSRSHSSARPRPRSRARVRERRSARRAASETSRSWRRRSRIGSSSSSSASPSPASPAALAPAERASSSSSSQRRSWARPASAARMKLSADAAQGPTRSLRQGRGEAGVSPREARARAGRFRLDPPGDEVTLDEGGGEGIEADGLATRGDRRQHVLRTIGQQDQVHERGWLLEGLRAAGSRPGRSSSGRPRARRPGGSTRTACGSRRRRPARRCRSPAFPRLRSG